MRLKNFGFKRKSGIIMPVASLPSPYGIGSFGKPCIDFIDFLDKCGQKCWQVLPLNPTSYGDSPYQSPSSFAGNPYFIDLEVLSKKGLLTKSEIKRAKTKLPKIDYGYLFNERFNLLNKAFNRFKPNEKYNKFVKKNAYWLSNYALFMALKIKNGYKPWWEWDESDKCFKIAKKQSVKLKNEINFFKFLQFEFFEEWECVLAYAKSKKIVIIGDLPIYVARDSVDVWSNTEEFLLDENLTPTLVAGVPPDAYSSVGQFWGNPVYDYDKMRTNGFNWWIKRIKHTKKLYDILRIDHFRAFAGYYVIPYGEETAVNGTWKQGVGYELFNEVFKQVKGVKIIAEDLGYITNDVIELLSHFNFPGMKVLEFAFYEENSIYLPKNYVGENCVVYTSTHDSETALEWVNTLNNEVYLRFKQATLPFTEKSNVYKLIALALSSKSNLALISMQDYLELGKEARINVPNIAMGNWTWRLKSNYGTNKTICKIKNINKKFKRIR